MDQTTSMELVLYAPPEAGRNDSVGTPSERFLGENHPKHVLAKLRGIKYRERTASWGRIADSSDFAIAPNSSAAYEYCLHKTQSESKALREPDPDSLNWADLNKIQRAAVLRDGLPSPTGAGMPSLSRYQRGLQTSSVPRYQHHLQTQSLFKTEPEPEVNASWSDALRGCIESIKVVWVWIADIGVVLVAILGMFYVLGCYPVE